MPGVPHVVCAQDLAVGLCAVVLVRCIIALHCMYVFFLSSEDRCFHKVVTQFQYFVYGSGIRI